MEWFRLASHLKMSVRRCQEEVSSREFVDWIAYSKFDPWGNIRGDLQMARICEAISLYMGTRKAGIEDFMFKFDRANDGQQSVDEMKAIFRMSISRKRKDKECRM